jgi:hypothetical protein
MIDHIVEIFHGELLKRNVGMHSGLWTQAGGGGTITLSSSPMALRAIFFISN